MQKDDPRAFEAIDPPPVPPSKPRVEPPNETESLSTFQYTGPFVGVGSATSPGTPLNASATLIRPSWWSILRDFGIRLTSRKFLLTISLILIVIINALKQNISGFSAMQISTWLTVAYVIVEGLADVAGRIS